MGSIVRGADGVQKRSGVDGAVVVRETNTNYGATPNAYQMVSFETEKLDEADYWDVANPTRLTVPRCGWYIVSASLQGVANASAPGAWALRFYVNGAQRKKVQRQHTASTGIAEQPSLSEAMYLQAGDYVELGTAHSVASTPSFNTVWATIMYVGDNTPAASLSNGSDGSPKRFADGVHLTFNTGSLSLNVSGAAFDVPFDTEDIDQADYWSSGDNTKVYAPREGWYFISTNAVFNAAAETFNLGISFNGTDYGPSLTYEEAWFTRQISSAAITQGLCVSGLQYLYKGDYVTLSVGTRTATDTCTDAVLTMVYLGTFNADKSLHRGADGRKTSYADGCALRVTGSVTITTANTNYFPAWDTEDVDQADYWNSGDSDAITVPRSGWGLVAFNCASAGAAAGWLLAVDGSGLTPGVAGSAYRRPDTEAAYGVSGGGYPLQIHRTASAITQCLNICAPYLFCKAGYNAGCWVQATINSTSMLGMKGAVVSFGD